MLDNNMLKKRLIQFSFFLLPFQLLLFAILSYKHTHIYTLNYFFQPVTILCIISLLSGFHLTKNKSLLWVLVCLVSLAAGYIISGTINSVDTVQLLSILLFGPIAIILVINLLSDQKVMFYIIPALILGMVIWSVASLVSLAILFHQTVWISYLHTDISYWVNALAFDRKIIALRYPNDFFFERLPLYYVFVGNMNKGANYIVLTLLLQTLLYLKNKIPHWFFITSYLIQVALLICLFSRGAFVVMFSLAICFIIYAKFAKTTPVKKQLKFVSLLLFLPVLISTTTHSFRTSWLGGVDSYLQRLDKVNNTISRTNQAIDNENNQDNKNNAMDQADTHVQSPLNQSNSNINSSMTPTDTVTQPNQAKQIPSDKPIHELRHLHWHYPYKAIFLYNHPMFPLVAKTIRIAFDAMRSSVAFQKDQSKTSLLLFGYGVGNYGLSQGGRPEAGTHFMLLDAWTDGGLLGICSLSLIFLIFFRITFQLLKRKGGLSVENAIGLMGIMAIFLLGLREYSLVYLFIQSFGAVLFAVFAVLTVCNNYNKFEAF